MKYLPASNLMSSNSPLTQSCIQDETRQDTSVSHSHVNDAAPTAERKLPRRATTRRTKLSRKSTRRVWRHSSETNKFDEFDEDNCVEADSGEELEFSETDSEHNEDKQASDSDGSDLEFETALARQMNDSQVLSSDFSFLKMNFLC